MRPGDSPCPPPPRRTARHEAGETTGQGAVIGLYYERRCRLSRQGRILSPGRPHRKSDDSGSYPTTQVCRHFATWQGNPHWPPEVGPTVSTLAHPRVESFTTSFARRTRAAHVRICSPGSPARVGFLDHLDLAQEMMTAGDPVAVLDAHMRARSELRLAATGSTNMRCLAAAGDHTPASNAPPR